MADQLAKLGSERPFVGPQPTWGISRGTAKEAARNYTTTRSTGIPKWTQTRALWQ
jgi:hypothetical protein